MEWLESMSKTTMGTLGVIGSIWLVILAITIVIGAVGIIAEGGMMQFWWVFSPFNVVNWILIGLLALPGVLLLRAGRKS